MIVSSVVVESEAGKSDAVLDTLSGIADVQVFGSKDDRIVTVIEGENVQQVIDTVRKLSDVAYVTGVFPVYTGQDA